MRRGGLPVILIALIASCSCAIAGECACTEPALAAELIAMLERDQAARSAPLQNLMTEMLEVDATNNARIIEIIRDSGWPSFSRVGREGAFAAFVLTQHLPTGHEVQLLAVKLMEPLLGQGEADRQAFAYLYDRTHRPQRFGTQGSCVAQGVWKAREVEHEATVDQRRAEAGMEPLAVYAEKVGRNLCAGAKKNQ